MVSSEPEVSVFVGLHEIYSLSTLRDTSSDPIELNNETRWLSFY